VGEREGVLGAQGIAADVDESSTPGYVDVTPHVDALSPEARQRLLSAIDAVRPAGVLVRLKDAVPPTTINLSLRLTTTAGMVEKDLKAVQRAVHDAVAGYFSGLPATDPGSVNRLIGVAQKVDGVEDVKIVKATRSDAAAEVNLNLGDGTLGLTGLTTVLGDLQITDPSLPTSLDVIGTYPAAS